MPQGVGGLVYLSDEDENVSRVSTAGRAYFSDSYTRIKNHSPINVSSASGGSGFESAPVGKMYVRSESGNSIMWLGGSSNDAPYSGHGFPLFGGETSPILYVNDFTATRVCASVSGQVVYAIGFLNGEDITLSRTSPVYPDITAPFIISHSPVSGLSGVSLDSDISVTFSEIINPSSVVSGVLALSPAHDVTIFRSTSTPTNAVLRPNVNLSGSTVYFATLVSGTITDLNGNIATSGIGWPFTTTNAPPPPDTTPPTVSGITPVSGGILTNLSDNMTVLFSEQMLSGSINSTNIFLTTVSGASTGNITTTVTLDSGDRKTVTIDPDDDLTAGTTYYINVTTGVQDLASNNLVDERRNHKFSSSYNFQEIYNVNGTEVSDAYATDVTRFGILITDTTTLTDAPIKKLTIPLRKGGSPTGTASVVIRNGARNVVYTFAETFDVSQLTTTFQDISFTDLNNTHTLIVGESITVEWTGGDSSNEVEYKKSSSNVFSGAKYFTYDGSWNDTTANDITAVLYK